LLDGPGVGPSSELERLGKPTLLDQSIDVLPGPVNASLAQIASLENFHLKLRRRGKQSPLVTQPRILGICRCYKPKKLCGAICTNRFLFFLALDAGFTEGLQDGLTGALQVWDIDLIELRAITVQ
jgi:hypothetical protein